MGAGGKTVKACMQHFVFKTWTRSLISAIVAVVGIYSIYCFHVYSLKWVLFLILLLLCREIFVFANWLVHLLEWMEPAVVWRIKTSQNVAALTIDDVPLLDAPSELKAVLGVLKKHDVKATLMVMSGFCDDRACPDQEKRKEYEELLQQAVRDGHELANHMKLDRPAIAMSNDEFDEDFKHCDDFLTRMAGGKQAWHERPKRWFRPASAVWNDHMLARAREFKYTPVISNCFPFDTVPVSRFWNSLYLRFVVRPGSVIVIHDRWHISQTLEKALPAMKSSGMELVTLSKLHELRDKEFSNDQKAKKRRLD